MDFYIMSHDAAAAKKVYCLPIIIRERYNGEKFTWSIAGRGNGR